jgi:hypothetical protein
MTALLLQAAYCDYQIGAFENFHQLVEDTLSVLRPGPKIFFQYELRFANCLKSQLLIGHPFLPIKQMQMLLKRKREKSSQFLEIPPLFSCFFEWSHQFLFQWGSPPRTIEATSCSTPLQTSTQTGSLAAAESRAMYF